MSKKINQDEINKSVWGACDTFRGVVDPSIYKDYVLTMLFLKYISDVSMDHYEKFQQEHGNEPELIEELMKCGRQVRKHAHDSRHYALYGQEGIGSTWALANLATLDEIGENDFNLNIPRYLVTFEEEEEIDLMAVRAEREGLKKELAVLEEKMEGYLEELGFK